MENISFHFLRSTSGSVRILFRASIASSGIVISAITRMLDTVRNLLYIGK